MTGSIEAASARQAALKRLVASHHDEWQRIYAEERARLGLDVKASALRLTPEEVTMILEQRAER